MKLLSLECLDIPTGALLGSGYRFNPSLAEHEDGYILSYRVDEASRPPQVGICRLGSDFAIGEPHLILPLQVREFAEDARLFWHRGFLHAAYNDGGRQSLAVLDPYTFSVISNRPVGYAACQPIEKNWQYFSVDGDLYCVYSVQPCRVLRLDADYRAEFETHPKHSAGREGPAQPTRRHVRSSPSPSTGSMGGAACGERIGLVDVGLASGGVAGADLTADGASFLSAAAGERAGRGPAPWGDWRL